MQLAQAASVNAEGIVLSAGVLRDELPSMVTASREYGLEPLVVVRTEDEVASAVAAEVEVIAVNGLSVDEMVAMVDTLPDTVVKVAFLPLYDDKQLIEAEDSWRLRDAGYNAVWASEVLYKFQSEDGDNTGTIIKAITSKGSVKWTRASLSYSGKGEGAKEFLGTLEM